MLTFSNKQSAVQASHYFQKDMGYYISDNRILGEIIGKASEALDLSGTRLTAQNYELHTMLCNGHYGSKRLIQKGAKNKHIAGFDITMADPKELSILRTYCKVKNHSFAEKLDLAHENAIEKTLNFIERYVGYRRLIDGKSKFIKSGKLIASRFEHETNRLDEPHMHTHHFIYNMTNDENGRWRAIENYYLFKNQDLFHMLWHVNLAVELHKIGIETQIISREKGTFKIKNFNREIIEYFSQRSVGIEQAFEDEEVLLKRELSIEEKSVIKIKLRPKKSKLLLSEIQNYFVNEIEEKFGFSVGDIDRLITLHPLQLRQDQIILNIIIGSAIDDLNSRGKMSFSYEELLKSAFLQTHSQNFTIGLKTIENAIASHPDLIHNQDGKIYRKLENLFMTQVSKKMKN